MNNSVKYAFEGILCSIITIKYSESKDHKKIYSLLSEWVGPPLSTLPPLCLLTQISESVPLTLAGLRGSPWASLSLSLSFWPHFKACRISVPQPGIEPGPRQSPDS